MSSLFDILEANDKSTLSGVNCGKLVGLHNGTVLVKTYDWSGHLAPYFKKLTGISKFRHFRVNKNYLGKLFYKEHADATEKEFEMWKDASILPPCLLPPQVLPSGSLAIAFVLRQGVAIELPFLIHFLSSSHSYGIPFP